MKRHFTQILFEADKQQHFIYSSFIYIIMALVTGDIVISSATCLYIGLIKEIWDHYAGSGFCWNDMTANALGCLFGISLHACFLMIF